MATAELAPLVRVGGLAEAVSGLVKALRADGLDVTVALPDYSAAALVGEKIFTLEVPEWTGPARARVGHLEGFGEVALIDLPGIARSHPYMRPDGLFGWDDNDRRFTGFSIACAALAVVIGADVVHANDWHTAAIFAFLPPGVRTVFGVHNLAYQGDSDAGWVDAFPNHGQAFLRSGRCNPMAGGVTVADRVVAVIGIRNGIDVSEWDPMIDRHLASNYGVSDFGVANPATKAANTAALRRRFNLEGGDGPLLGIVTRLVHQKGLDLVEGLAPYLASVDAQLVVLGSGDPPTAARFRALAQADPARVAFFEGYDIALSHQVFAGADLYLMPSRFEPCGLAQMQAMAYGAIPIVTNVGGLHDTVIDADSQPASGNGFIARHLDEAGLVDAVHRAARAWRERRRRADIIRRGMRTDWSWTAPAKAYRALYESLG